MLINKALAIALGGLLLASSASAAPLFSYRCDDGHIFHVAYPDSDHAVMIYNDDVKLLRIAVAASGARYTGSGWQWWIKGQEEGNLAALAEGQRQATEQGRLCKRVHGQTRQRR